MKEGLKARRLRHGYTVRKLAKLSGVPKTTIERWETIGVESASAGKLKKLADALGCKVDDLF